MTGLTEDQQALRIKNLVNASEAHNIMGGYDDPEPVAPPRDFEHFVPMETYIQPRYAKGERKFLVRDINPKMDFKVDTPLIEATIKVIKWDAPKKHPSTLITYAHERVRKRIFNDPDYDHPDTYAMRVGRERESDAIVELGSACGVAFRHTDDQKPQYKNGVGATPDGLAYDELDLFKMGGEVKSFAPNHHEACCLVKDQKQLRAEQFEIYAQCQTGLYASEAPQWAVGFYNPHSKIPELKFRHLIIEPDELFFTVLEKRVLIIQEIIDKRWEEINNAIAA